MNKIAGTQVHQLLNTFLHWCEYNKGQVKETVDRIIEEGTQLSVHAKKI